MKHTANGVAKQEGMRFMADHFTRAHLLIEQSRHAMAERELRLAIAEDPNDANAHALLGVALSGQGKAEEALAECREAVGLSPDDPHVHYTLAAVLHDHDRYKESLAAVEQAIELDPYRPHAHALRGQLMLQRREWAAALRSAEEALAIDAEHIAAANIRAIALTKLGRRDEAGATIDAALARNPEEAVTHANMGWTLLHGGSAGGAHKAAEHFREALRLEPDNEWARAGIVEALKARNIIYRTFLRHVLWMTRLKPGVRLALFIGAIVLIQLLVRLPEGTPMYWVGIGLAIAYMLFVMTCWTADPLFNLLLRVDKFGRLALSDDQRKDSTWMGLGMVAVGLLAAAPLVTGFRVADTIDYLLLMLAVGVTLNVPRQARRKLAATITIALIAIAAVHCYRWHLGPLPIPRYTDPKQIEEFLVQRLSAGDTDTINRATEFLRSQRSYNEVFVWGVVLMTWLAGLFHRKP